MDDLSMKPRVSVCQSNSIGVVKSIFQTDKRLSLRRQGNTINKNVKVKSTKNHDCVKNKGTLNIVQIASKNKLIKDANTEDSKNQIDSPFIDCLFFDSLDGEKFQNISDYCRIVSTSTAASSLHILPNNTDFADFVSLENYSSDQFINNTNKLENYNSDNLVQSNSLTSELYNLSKSPRKIASPLKTVSPSVNTTINSSECQFSALMTHRAFGWLPFSLVSNGDEAAYHSRYFRSTRLGGGTYGEVFKAFPRIASTSSIKSLPANAVKIIDLEKVHTVNPSDVARMKQEAALLQKLDHPNIIKVHEVYESRKYLWVVMELCQGGSLEDRPLLSCEPNLSDSERYKRAKNWKSNEPETRFVMRQILRALCYLHNKGIAHRDVKTDNFMWTSVSPNSNKPSTLKLVDFGLANYNAPQIKRDLKESNKPLINLNKPNLNKPLNRESCDASSLRSRSRQNADFLRTRAGSPVYVAPEIVQFAPDIPYGCKVDCWSAGIVMHFLLTHFFPFQGEHDSQTLDLVVKAKINYNLPPYRRLSNHALSLLTRLLCKQPEYRISASEALEHDWLKDPYPPKTISCLLSPLSERLQKRKSNGSFSFANRRSRSASPTPPTHRDYREILFIESILKGIIRFHAAPTLKKLAMVLVAKFIPDEAVNEIVELFRDLDRSKTGILGLKDAIDGLLVLLQSIPNDIEVNFFIDAIKSLDINNTGKIEITVFVAATLPRGGFRRDGSWVREQGIRTNLKELDRQYSMAIDQAFFQLDHGRNGFISQRDIQKFLKIPVTDDLLNELMVHATGSPKESLSRNEFKKVVFDIYRKNLLEMYEEHRPVDPIKQSRDGSPLIIRASSQQTDCSITDAFESKKNSKIEKKHDIDFIEDFSSDWRSARTPKKHCVSMAGEVSNCRDFPIGKARCTFPLLRCHKTNIRVENCKKTNLENLVEDGESLMSHPLKTFSLSDKPNLYNSLNNTYTNIDSNVPEQHFFQNQSDQKKCNYGVYFELDEKLNNPLEGFNSSPNKHVSVLKNEFKRITVLSRLSSTVDLVAETLPDLTDVRENRSNQENMLEQNTNYNLIKNYSNDFDSEFTMEQTNYNRSSFPLYDSTTADNFENKCNIEYNSIDNNHRDEIAEVSNLQFSNSRVSDSQVSNCQVSSSQVSISDALNYQPSNAQVVNSQVSKSTHSSEQRCVANSSFKNMKPNEGLKNKCFELKNSPVVGYRSNVLKFHNVSHDRARMLTIDSIGEDSMISLPHLLNETEPLNSRFSVRSTLSTKFSSRDSVKFSKSNNFVRKSPVLTEKNCFNFILNSPVCKKVSHVKTFLKTSSVTKASLKVSGISKNIKNPTNCNVLKKSFFFKLKDSNDPSKTMALSKGPVEGIPANTIIEPKQTTPRRSLLMTQKKKNNKIPLSSQTAKHTWKSVNSNSFGRKSMKCGVLLKQRTLTVNGSAGLSVDSIPTNNKSVKLKPGFCKTVLGTTSDRLKTLTTISSVKSVKKNVSSDKHFSKV